MQRHKKAEPEGGGRCEDGSAQTSFSALRGLPPSAAEPATITTLRYICSVLQEGERVIQFLVKRAE